MEWSGKIMNMHNKKTQRTIAAVIVMVLIPTLTEQAVFWITIVDIVFMLIAFAEYLLAYMGNESKFQEVDFKKKDEA